MAKVVRISEICGIEVLSRANIRKLHDIIDSDTEMLDMSGITFVSRSVADELCNICESNVGLSLINVADNVAQMISIVRKGRNVKREYVTKSKVSMTFNCETFDDLRKALSFGS